MSENIIRRPTEEQLAAINALRMGTPKIEIGAFAGTGKTSLFEMCVEDMPKTTNFIYIVFNKSGEIEAKERFAKFNNIEIRTVNALAFANYPERRGVNIAFYKRQDIERLLGLGFKQAKRTLELFEAYCNGDSLVIDNQNVQSLWDMMEIGKIDPTHSFILKSFHLNLATSVSLPILNKKIDVVMIDEYQDTNPVTLAIADLIQCKTYMKVGDKHQGIYAFRGANNIMGKDSDAATFKLTQSFRFNQHIANLANTLLSTYKGETAKLKGLGKQTAMRSACLLSRTNAELLTGIKTLYEARQPFKTIRDPKLLFDLPMSIHQMNKGGEARKGCFYLKWEYKKYQDSRTQYSSFTEYLKESAKLNKDKELMTACKMVERIPHDLMGKMEEKANEYFSQDMLKVKYFLSTIHTAKGLEWDYVKIADDLYDMPRMVADYIFQTYGDIGDTDKYNFIEQFREDALDGEVPTDLIEEFNLAYVAVTRAKVKVEYGGMMSTLLDPKEMQEQIRESYKDIREKAEDQELKQEEGKSKNNYMSMMVTP